KIYNNVTTTSNVFAVWWTVGFFEVEDETVRPARLGAEIGKAENRHIRHRFFAIVDRSGMNLFQTTPTNSFTFKLGQPQIWNSMKGYAVKDAAIYNGLTYECVQANTGNLPLTSTKFWSPVTMFITPPVGNAGKVTITLQPGMLLELGSGATGEVVRVEAVVAGNGFRAAFTKDFSAGVTPVICRGNPGPRQNYNPKQDNQVVLHLSVIE
ncbi:MAG: hypothetical protein EXS16_20190, partial [Gemmataceae bacterium]|nr:hypothetical protein [Gemmataceae bacterium]